MESFEKSLNRFECLKELAKKKDGHIEPVLYESEIETIIIALKKQIPENVIWKLQSKDKGTNNYECFCPFCNTKLSPYEHHCKCGQALIWSKVN